MASLYQRRELLDFPAERVALTSFRSAMAGYDLGDPSCWDDLWNNLVAEGGVELACKISGSLHFFVRSLRHSRQGKLKYFPLACKRACTDECLILSLLSASQHNTADTLMFCMKHLHADESGRIDIIAAAQLLGQELQAAGFALLPVPLNVIKSIMPTQCRDCKILDACPTLN